jgi:hypothetical protein
MNLVDSGISYYFSAYPLAQLMNIVVVGAEGGPLFIACINHNLIYYPYALFSL